MKTFCAACFLLLICTGESFGQRVTVEQDERFQLFDFLRRPAVQKLISITPEQAATIRELDDWGQRILREGRDAGGTAFYQADLKRRAAALAFLDELLTPESEKKLMQLKMRDHVCTAGLKAALLEGALGQKIGLYENQLTHLEEKTTKILNEAEAKIQKIREEAELQVLNELSDEQQAKAKDLLGPYYEFSPIEERAAWLKDLKDRAKAKRINQPADWK